MAIACAAVGARARRCAACSRCRGSTGRAPSPSPPPAALTLWAGLSICVVDRGRPARGTGSRAASSTSPSSRSGCSRERSPAARGASRRSLALVLARRARLGAARRRDPVALPGRRPHRAPARARRLLERARAARGRGARARPLGGAGVDGRGAGSPGCLLVYGAVLALLLTQSRAGVVGAVAVLAPLARPLRRAARGRARARSSPGVPALARRGLGVHPARRSSRTARCAPTASADGQGVRGADARGAHRRRARAHGALPVRRLVAERGRAVRTALVGLCVARGRRRGSVGLVAKVGNPFSWASLPALAAASASTTPGASPTSARTTGCQWWGEALDVAADRPVGGSGAGTFALARRRYRENATPVTEPHSVPLQLLADLGVVGPRARPRSSVGGAIVGRRRGLRRRTGGRPARPAAALACLVLAYGVHALVDYDLDFLAVTRSALLALGALLAVGRPRVDASAPACRASSRSPPSPAAAVARGRAARAGRPRGRPGVRGDRRRPARRTPSTRPTARGASTRSRSGRSRRARSRRTPPATGRRRSPGTRRRPSSSPRTRTPGTTSASTRRSRRTTSAPRTQALNHSYTLDPKSSRWVAGGPLDVARDAVNDGACEN